MERSILLFKNSVKSEHSYKTYVDKLNRFMEFAGVSSYDELTGEKNLQELLEDWIMTIKPQISPNSVPYYFYAIKSFLEVNDVELRWKKIIRLFPAKEKKTGRKPYTTKEVQKILAVAKDLRSRALVLFLASSGVRIGAIPDLRVRHLVDLPLGCKGIIVYEGSTEEYWTIITPEATEALNQYLEKETYHAGKTPKLGEKIIEPRLVPVNLTKILSFLENYDQEDPEQRKVKDIELQAKYARFFDQKISIPLAIATAILVAGAMGWLVV